LGGISGFGESKIGGKTGNKGLGGESNTGGGDRGMGSGDVGSELLKFGFCKLTL